MPNGLRDMMDAARIGRLQWVVAACMVCVMMLDGLDLQLAAFSAPMLMTQWQLTKPEFSPLLAAAMIGMAFGTLIGSWAGDRFGRKPALVASVAFFGTMTVACATSGSPNEFAAWRFMSGLGFGAAFPVAAAMMGEWMPRRAAGKAISIMTIGIPIGIMVGALGASSLLPLIGWRRCFAGTGAMCIGFALLMLWKLPESPSYQALKGRFEAVNAVLSRAWGKTVSLDAGELRQEVRQKNASGLFDKGNARLNIGLCLAVLFNSFATYAIGGWLTVILTDLQLPLGVALRGPLTVSFSAILGALVVGSLLVRLGSRATMLGLAVIAIVCAIVISVAVALLPTGAALFTTLFVALAIGGFCAGGLQPAFYVLAASAYETRTRSRGIGLAAVMGRVGAISSSFAGGAVLAVGHAGGFFALVAALGVACVAGILVIDRHTPGIGRQRQLNTAAEYRPRQAGGAGDMNASNG